MRVHDYEKASPLMRQTLINVTQEDLRPLLGAHRYSNGFVLGQAGWHDTIFGCAHHGKRNSPVPFCTHSTMSVTVCTATKLMLSPLPFARFYDADSSFGSALTLVACLSPMLTLVTLWQRKEWRWDGLLDHLKAKRFFTQIFDSCVRHFLACG